MIEPTDEQLMIQALQGQVQFLSARAQLMEREIAKLRAQLKERDAGNPVPD